jgi:hypothetical protein
MSNATRIQPIKAKELSLVKLSDYLSSSKFVNALFLKVAWVACVVGGNSYGLGVVFAMLCLNTYQRNIAADWPYAVGLGLFGLLLDTAWMHFGVLDYASSASLTIAGITLAPLWIVLLWVAVGLSLNHGLIFFVERPLIGGLLVGASAPFSYMAGERFGAVVIPSYENLAILGLIWFVVYYVLFSLTNYVNGRGEAKDEVAPITQSV